MEWNSFQETTRRLMIFHVKTRGDDEEEEEKEEGGEEEEDEELFRIKTESCFGAESIQHS